MFLPPGAKFHRQPATLVQLTITQMMWKVCSESKLICREGRCWLPDVGANEAEGWSFGGRDDALEKLLCALVLCLLAQGQLSLTAPS